MRKWSIIVLSLLLTSNFLFAQQQNIEIKGNGNSLFLEHVVAPKESLYSVSRMFNIAPRDLATFNKLTLEASLNIGQLLKVPLSPANFTQVQKAAGNEVLVPLVHTVEPNETLYRLGVHYNKVPLGSLKKWNHLSSDAVTEGTPMIVGFLRVDKNQSALASAKFTPAEVVKNEKVKKAEIVVAKDPEPVKKEVKEAVVEQKIEAPKETVTTVKAKPNVNFEGGAFKKFYDQQSAGQSNESIAGTSGVFKSTSGWQDGKYYCFYDKVAPGNYIKITDNTSGKSVYAKVLDAIPEIKQNDGLTVIISNAAAEELGAGSDKFTCTVTYSK